MQNCCGGSCNGAHTKKYEANGDATYLVPSQLRRKLFPLNVLLNLAAVSRYLAVACKRKESYPDWLSANRTYTSPCGLRSSESLNSDRIPTISSMLTHCCKAICMLSPSE